MRDDPLIGLIMVFVPFSLISIGGGASIIAGMENQVVSARGWLSAQQFLELFAISRAAPGPGVMLATLVGWKLAGWMGAIVASLALFVPSSLLCYTVFRVSNAHRDKRWHRAMREGLAPVGTGLIIAGVMSIFGLMGKWQAATIAIAAAAVLNFLPRIPTLVIIAVGGIASLLIYKF
ncbi:chromate transporter [Pararhizobium gei]|uniref:chromate transporter n=1 Tax=Pararhizobium gei TaxID=1395951 RepID=UPI0023DC42F6|nr:chromate transporter [Rhizobium gei]